MKEEENPDFYNKRPYFVKGDFMLRWYGGLSKEEQEALEFIVSPNPLMDAKRKVLEHLEKYGIISYQMARDMKLIPTQMSTGAFAKMVKNDHGVTIYPSRKTRSDCNRNYYLFARDSTEAIYNMMQGEIRDE